jgi:protocatechuate 3,4-dioxygenase beta subunit
MTEQRLCVVFRIVILAGLSYGVAGCDGLDRSRSGFPPAAPSPVETPASPVPPVATTAITLAGTVADAAWRPLAGARVEVLSGPQAGKFAVTNNRGEFSVSGEFDDTTRFRATMDGHREATGALPPRCAACDPHWWIHFGLEAFAPHADLTGAYTVTLTADSACTGLPEQARSRTFDVTVTRLADSEWAQNSRFTVTGGAPPLLGNRASFPIGVAGDHVAGFTGDLHGTPSLVEEIGPNTYVGFDGAIAASADSSGATISGAFDGLIEHCGADAPMGPEYQCTSERRKSCTSTNHQFRLVRR